MSIKEQAEALPSSISHFNFIMSKPILYTFPLSVWAAVPEVARIELGYQSESIESKVINLVNGENFNPEFLKINPNATLPALVAEGRTYTTTTDVVRYLIGHAPKKVPYGNPALISRIHEDSLDPNFPLLAARDETSLSAASSGFASVFVNNRQNALLKYVDTPEAEPFKTSVFEPKIQANGAVLDIYTGKASDEVKQVFFKQCTQHWNNISDFILKELPGYLPESGFINGDVPGEDDFHIGIWLVRIANLCGGTPTKDSYRC
ncbi:hypothetical protein BXZ70DRAFT_1059164 [Cristinia sonorae]|uniref:GST N-terminal domain-containing protein n=1 Tax=Cristinia sonorae TaxID=1940300 RepID=A0A8K0URS3_9AGAR|nr:hypothetical protein BXZ70DRAFT_1059164 [Cristinia sonorae]